MRHDNFVGISPCGIPFGHISWNFGKKYLSIPQVLQFVKGEFQNKMLSRATCELHWCFDASIMMHDRGGEYGWEDNTCVMAQHEELESSQFEPNIVRSSNFSTFTFDRIWFDLHFFYTRLKFPQPLTWKIGWDVVHHIERPRIIYKKTISPSNRNIDDGPLAMLELTRCLSLFYTITFTVLLNWSWFHLEYNPVVGQPSEESLLFWVGVMVVFHYNKMVFIQHEHIKLIIVPKRAITTTLHIFSSSDESTTS